MFAEKYFKNVLQKYGERSSTNIIIFEVVLQSMPNLLSERTHKKLSWKAIRKWPSLGFLSLELWLGCLLPSWDWASMWEPRSASAMGEFLPSSSSAPPQVQQPHLVHRWPTSSISLPSSSSGQSPVPVGFLEARSARRRWLMSPLISPWFFRLSLLFFTTFMMMILTNCSCAASVPCTSATARRRTTASPWRPLLTPPTTSSSRRRRRPASLEIEAPVICYQVELFP